MIDLGMLLALALAAPPASPAAPAGKKAHEERMDVEDVMGTGDGQFVVLLRTQGRPVRYLPIWIGETEAIAIRMRLDRQEPPRPLTLNLLEQVMRAANIRITEISIDDFKGGVFLGRIRVRQNNKNWEMEARPSDAIGLAMGRHAPILVTQDILDGAGIDPKSLRSADPPPQSPAQPQPRGPSATALDESL